MSIISERKILVDREYVPCRCEDILQPNPMYNKRLFITIPGDPVSDGRPRNNRELQIFYNAKKEFLKKIFKVIYDRDPLLKKMAILSPHDILIQTYAYPTKSDLKFLDEKDVFEEKIFSIATKDNDNVEKVNWDVLQDVEFQIILNDTYTVGNRTLKYYSFNPRTVITIDYNTGFVQPLYKHKIESSVEYRFFKCAKKYVINILEKDDEDAVKYLTENLINIGSKAHKKLKIILSQYNTNIIDGVFHNYAFKGIKSENILRYVKTCKKDYKIDFIISLLVSSDKLVKEKLDEQKKILKNLGG